MQKSIKTKINTYVNVFTRVESSGPVFVNNFFKILLDQIYFHYPWRAKSYNFFFFFRQYTEKKWCWSGQWHLCHFHQRL